MLGLEWSGVVHGSVPERSYHPFVRLTIRTTESITGTSTNTQTTVARAAPERIPKTLIAVATASSKKLAGADQC